MKPDLNAPRFREKYTTLLTKEFAEKFNEKYSEHKDITSEEFKTIVRKFNEILVQGAIDNRSGIELPDGLGYIFLGTCQASKKKTNVDFKKLIDHGINTTHKNWESDNKLLKIFYSNSKARYGFANKEVWYLVPSRYFKRTASAAYRKNWSKYVEISSTVKISDMFERQRKKDYKHNLKPIVPENYDEFKID
jgi:hypothetical protein